MINQLKSLELQGYKTFASKTLFEFPGQVTAIVGPNGSGKSNIADAIRWVLGEQAYTLLRGKKTMDMIFSGSEQRPRASMASVSISFDNETGWLPIEFTEVLITRRAYRSGENEYLLNNQRVRLKEINELLANSGLGERTYTIIGQGLVDLALSLRPGERRRFFEEAAGISLYRSRREEAVQKLDLTLRNMERVVDIMGELSPRLKSLEKSREKSVQYKQIQDDLFVLLRDWYGYYWHAALKDMNNARDFYNHQKENFDSKRFEKEKVEEELNRIQSNLNQNRILLADLHSELGANHQSYEKNNRELAVLEEREKSLQARLQEGEQTLLRVSIEGENNQKALNELDQEEQALQSNHTAAKNELIQAQQKIQEKSNQLQEINIQVDQTRKAILENETAILELQAHIRAREREISERTEEIASSKVFIEKSINSLEQEKQKKIEFEKQIEQNQKAIERNIESANHTTLELNEKKDRKQQLFEELQRMEFESSRFAAELEMILDDESNYSGLSSGSREIIRASSEGKISGDYSLVVQQLDIPEEYERCISAALGEISEGVVAADKLNVLSLLDFINRNNVSRTAIVNREVKRRPVNPISSYRLASELVVSQNAYADRIKDILSEVIIVENADDAVRLVKDLQPGWKVVTMQGDVFECTGVITSGKPKGLQPIKRKREKKAVELKLVELEAERKIIENTLHAITSDIQSREDALKILGDQLANAKEVRQQVLLSKHKTEIELSQTIKVIDQEKDRVQMVETALAEWAQTLLDYKEKIESYKNKFRQLEEQEIKLTYAGKHVNIEDDRLQLINMNSRCAVAEEILNQHKQRIKAQRELAAASRKKSDELKQQLDTFSTNLEQTRRNIKQLVQENGFIKEEIFELNKKITPLDQQVETVIGQQVKLLEDVDLYRRNYAIAERHTLQTQMKVEKLRGNIDMLRIKIEEDFGMISGDAELGLVPHKPLPFEELLTRLPYMEKLPDDLGEQIKQKKAFLRRMGPINPEAEKEYEEVSQRYSFLQEQLQDLEQAEKDLRKVVQELDGLMQTEFMRTFQMVDKEFRVIFSQLFNGGTAHLLIEDGENILDSGIEIETTLPGRRKQELALLSGGERSLIAVALIFALLKISPTPFCVLDEVDAMLDETNVVRFGDLLRDLSDTTQFIVITHNRNTVRLADILYGVTMGRDSVSQVISLKLDELTDELVQ